MDQWFVGDLYTTRIVIDSWLNCKIIHLVSQPNQSSQTRGVIDIKQRPTSNNNLGSTGIMMHAFEVDLLTMGL